MRRQARARRPAISSPASHRRDEIRRRSPSTGQGRRYLERPDDPDNLEYALRLFRSATEKEPRFALAYAAAGETLWLKYRATKNSEFVDQARESLTEALRLDPNAVEVRYALAVLYEGTGRREQAAEELQQIVEQQPEFDSAHRLYGRILLSQGQAERWMGIATGRQHTP